MEDIINKVTPLIINCGKETNLEIVDIEWVKESGANILRILANSPEGLTIEESTTLNELVSLKLDEVDLIDEEYYLEVSSPGLEMPIKTNEQLLKAIDEYICIKTFKKIESFKEFIGFLKEVNDDKIKIECNIKGRNRNFEIERSLISSTRYAVKF